LLPANCKFIIIIIINIIIIIIIIIIINYFLLMNFSSQISKLSASDTIHDTKTK